MKQYYLNNNQQSNGDYEVHTTDCPYLPSFSNRIDLGIHSTCATAVAKAKVLYPYRRINGCFHCCYFCHTT